MSRRSNSCYGRVSGKLLMEYDTMHEAQEGATHVQERYGHSMVPYQCQQCSFWHLSPMDRQTEHSPWACDCLDERGCRKDGYQSKKAAEQRARILYQVRGQVLNVYLCPDAQACGVTNLWHLTKQEQYEDNSNDDYYGHCTSTTSQNSHGRRSTQCRNRQGEYRMEYDDEYAAENAAKYVLERHGTQVEPYVCGSCGMWHLGAPSS